MTMTITKTSGSKQVTAYTSTKPQRIDGEIVVITGYGRSMDDSGKYIHRMAVRPATEAEAAKVELDEKLAAMEAELKDMRSRELDAHIAGTKADWQAKYDALRDAYLAARKLVK